MDKNQLRERTKQFACRCIKLSLALLSIVIEEVDETCFWMEFIIDEQLLNKTKIMPLLGEAKELTAIFIASRKTARKIVNSK
ncbi:MAG TPA: hypothetical protein VMW23_05185 [Sedimentisphaerales bacterium]|nr:hypothetical protein [Sedimentisphaerales bacterium]